MATPVREVTWADFLLADVLTSLAKALSDTERAVCLLVSHGSILEPHARDQVCCSAPDAPHSSGPCSEASAPCVCQCSQTAHCCSTYKAACLQ